MAIESNDQADKEAKSVAVPRDATHQQNCPPTSLNSVRLKSVQVQNINSEIKKAAAKEWDLGKTTS